MARNPKIELLLEAKDKITDVLEDVAKRTDDLAKKQTEVKVDVDAAKATDVLADIRDKMGRLDKEEAEVLLKAETKAATVDLKNAQKRLISLDDEEAEVEVKADIADARKRLDAIDAEVEKLDKQRPEVEVEADVALAEKKVGDLQNLLADVDSEFIRPQIEAKVANAQADVDKFRAELKSLDSAVASPEIDVPNAEGARSKIAGVGEKLAELPGLAGAAGGSLASMGAAGGPAGAAIAAGMAVALAGIELFKTGVEKIKLKANFRDQFGLITADAKSYGKKAGDVYADGWGDSLKQVQDAIGKVRQLLVETGVVSQGMSDEVVTSALAIADVFGMDVTEVISALRSILTNGLAPDAEAALDVFVAGLQDGNDYAGDLADTIGEYSQHFAEFGISAEDASNIFSAGMRNGQRDTDKLADAVKEMRVKSLEDTDAMNAAYSELGLSADDFRARIAEGGPSARLAFIQILSGIQSVEDPVRKQALGVEFLSTMYEDLGTGGVESLLGLAGATKEVEGANDNLVTNQDNATSQVTIAWRRVESAIGYVAEGFAKLSNMLVLGPLIDGLDRLGRTAGWVKDQFTTELSGSLNLVDEKVVHLTGDMSQSTLAMDLLRSSSVALGEGANNMAGDLSTSTARMDELRSATEQATTSLQEHIDKQRAAIDPVFAAMKASDDYAVALMNLRVEGGNTAENQRELVEAGLDVEAALANVAEQGGTTGQKMYDLGLSMGLTETEAYQLAGAVGVTTAAAEDLAGDYEATLIADDVPARGAIAVTRGEAEGYAGAGYNATLNADGSPARGQVAVTRGEAEGYAHTYSASLDANDQASGTINSVRANADRLNGKRSVVQIITQRIEEFYGGYGEPRRKDVGGSLASGQSALVAERRPEYVNGQLLTRPTVIEGPATIDSGASTAGKLRNRGSAPVAESTDGTYVDRRTINNIVNVGPGYRPRDIDDLQRKHERRNGIRR